MRLLQLIQKFKKQTPIGGLDQIPSIRVPVVANIVGVPDISSNAPRDHFISWAQSLGSEASVLEVGTKQAVVGTSTHSRAWFPNVSRQNYVMVDQAPGMDVDVIADLHALPADWTNRFEAFLASAVFEHLERPWIAAKEVARILAPEGCCYIATHQSFPLHGYPCDFFRFSREALSLIFADAGLEIVEVAYLHRAKILAPAEIMPASFQDEWNATWPSYLVVHLIARKSSRFKKS